MSFQVIYSGAFLVGSSPQKFQFGHIRSLQFVDLIFHIWMKPPWVSKSFVDLFQAEFKTNNQVICWWSEVSLDESDHWIMWFWWKPFLTFGEQFRALFWNGETLDVLWIELFLDQLFASDRVRNNGSVGDLCWILGFRVFKSCEERIFRFVS